MNQWWFLGFVAWSLLMFAGGFKVESIRASEHEKSAVVAAQAAVIAKQQKSNIATQEVTNAYEAQIHSIDKQYDAIMGMFPTGHSMQSIPGSSVRVDGSAGRKCPEKSRAVIIKVAATCDKQAAQLAALQEWVRKQQAIK